MSEDGRADQFFSEEDLDLQNLTWDELIATWNAWLAAASITDDERPAHTHGVFVKPERG